MNGVELPPVGPRIICSGNIYVGQKIVDVRELGRELDSIPSPYYLLFNLKLEDML